MAADGSGACTSVMSAVRSVPQDNLERRIILVKRGVYRERVRVEVPFITLRGEKRAKTRVEFPHPASEPVDELGRAVLDLGPNAHDFVLENITVENTHGVVGVHAFAILGAADRTIIHESLASCRRGRGAHILMCGLPDSSSPSLRSAMVPRRLDLRGGAIIATVGSVSLRVASTQLPPVTPEPLKK